jgi:hypothetical protein
MIFKLSLYVLCFSSLRVFGGFNGEFLNDVFEITIGMCVCYV